jgi:hypothetical protein
MGADDRFESDIPPGLKVALDSPVRLEIISNVRALVDDSELLLKNSRFARATSLAILAFEEAGKGHALELGINKPKSIRSFHQFRHLISLFVLSASMYQKYEIDVSDITAKWSGLLREQLDRIKGFEEFPSVSPEGYRADILKYLSSTFNAMGEKQRKIAEVEFRFLIKVTRAIATGNLEGLRQKGLYVDYCNDEIVSTPSAVTQVDAEMWTWAAQRVLNLLEHGEFRQAYTPLSALLGHGETNVPLEDILRGFQGE